MPKHIRPWVPPALPMKPNLDVLQGAGHIRYVVSNHLPGHHFVACFLEHPVPDLNGPDILHMGVSCVRVVLLLVSAFSQKRGKLKSRATHIWSATLVLTHGGLATVGFGGLIAGATAPLQLKHNWPVHGQPQVAHLLVNPLVGT